MALKPGLGGAKKLLYEIISIHVRTWFEFVSALDIPSL